MSRRCAAIASDKSSASKATACMASRLCKKACDMRRPSACTSSNFLATSAAHSGKALARPITVLLSKLPMRVAASSSVCANCSRGSGCNTCKASNCTAGFRPAPAPEPALGEQRGDKGVTNCKVAVVSSWNSTRRVAPPLNFPATAASDRRKSSLCGTGSLTSCICASASIGAMSKPPATASGSRKLSNGLNGFRTSSASTRPR
mmetsp:Transcript_62953/g.175375  ORF Transcript_62953/g.175375 Transcript_62953/m.175375 type:complete len:204 (+) Transcript_62953:660-1271(+)